MILPMNKGTDDDDDDDVVNVRQSDIRHRTTKPLQLM